MFSSIASRSLAETFSGRARDHLLPHRSFLRNRWRACARRGSRAIKYLLRADPMLNQTVELRIARRGNREQLQVDGFYFVVEEAGLKQPVHQR